MDPITALQCASAILSFVDFGVKLVSKSKEIYKSAEGVLVDHAEQDAVAKRLSVLSDGLVLSIKETSKVKKLMPAERILEQIAIECNKAAIEFTSAIDELRITGKSHKWRSFRQALKSLWSKDKIEQKRMHFERLRQEILTHVLVIIHDSQEILSRVLPAQIDSTSKAIINVVLSSRTELMTTLSDLSVDLHTTAKLHTRQFTSLLAKQTAAIDEIRRVGEQWMFRNEQRLDTLVQHLQETQIQRKNAQLRTALLKGLAFEQMFDRSDDIGPKAEKTFEWVISTPPSERAPWNDLNKWFQSQRGVYFIVGKAGSGKSTMMKWLAEQPRVRNLLDIWADGRKLLILKCFFWSSGANLQRSSFGFFRSILHDLLSQCPGVVTAFSSQRLRSATLELDFFPSWSADELVSTVNVILKSLSASSAICLFVDGLDECTEDDGHRQKILSFINQTLAKSHIKVIASSRPLHDIEFELEVTPDLYLHDLTAHDIKTFVEARLTSDERFHLLLAINRSFAGELALQITQKAEGVFLWVRLVVESLLRGIRNRDAPSDLSNRLHETSAELDNLFGRMLSAIEPVYRMKVLKLLKIVLEQPDAPSLMTCSFLDDYQPLFAVHLPLTVTSSKDLHPRLSVANTHIKARCLGLLEIREAHPSSIPIPYPDATFMICYGQSVEFLHSTAREYLTQNASLLFQHRELLSFNTDLFMAEALLAQIKLSRNMCVPLIFHLLSVIIRLPRPLCEDALLLLRDLDRTISMQEPIDNVEAQMTCRYYNLDCKDPLLSVAIAYDIFEYVELTITARPEALTCARHFPLLVFALKNRIRDTGRPETMLLPASYGSTYSENKPDLQILELLLSRNVDPNAHVSELGYRRRSTRKASNLGFGSFHDYSVWDDFMRFLNRHGAQIRAQDDQTFQTWLRATQLLLEYGAGHRTSIFPQHWLSYKPLPPESFVVAFGYRNSRKLESLALWRCITFRNFARHILTAIRSSTQSSHPHQATKSGSLVLDMLVNIFVFVSFTVGMPVIIGAACLTTWVIVCNFLRALGDGTIFSLVVDLLSQQITWVLIGIYCAVKLLRYFERSHYQLH